MRLPLLVLLGSGIGGLLRFWVGTWLPSATFPWATLLVNLLGSFAIGAAASGLAADQAGARAFAMAGVCGGFTTFSAYSLQTLELLQGGRAAAAGAYAAGSVVGCLIATWSGWALLRAI